MENYEILQYRLINNEKTDKDEMEKQLIETKLNLRKKKLYQILLQKRQMYMIQNSLNDKMNQLKEISILIHKNTFDENQTGLNKFYDFLISNEKLEKNDIKYIYTNIYYRLLDIINSEKNYEKNGQMSKVLFLIHYLATDNNIFIEPITENVFLINLKEMIEININNLSFISQIVPILSYMLINKKKFGEIMKEIDVGKIMKMLIVQKIENKDSIEQLLILMNNFIININEHKTSKYIFILEYVLSLINDNITNYLNNEDDSMIILSLFDILIHMTYDQENFKLVKESNCIQFIKYLIDNNYKENMNNNDNIYLVKSIKLLSNIILMTKNFEDKKNIISYIYSNQNNNKEISSPFVTEFINSIINKNFLFANALLNCIINLINNCAQFCELYCYNDFINCLLKLMEENIMRKLKNEIMIFFINIIECNGIKVYKYLLNFDIMKILVTYLNKKKKTKKESTKIIIYNILLFIKKCLSIEEENNMNIIKTILNNYNYKEIIEYLIENKDESISDISRTTFIKYFSKEENVYKPSKSNNKKDENEDMIIE